MDIGMSKKDVSVSFVSPDQTNDQTVGGVFARKEKSQECPWLDA